MNSDKDYLKLIYDIRKAIINSRYQAMRVVNKEQLLLYLRTGKILSEKIDENKWGLKNS
jgi:hypothetical protein